MVSTKLVALWPFWMTEIRNLFWTYLQHGCRRPFWMNENNSDRISRYFGSIHNFYICFAKWPPTAIFDDRRSLSFAFLAISDQYATFVFNFFSQNGRRCPFWMTEHHFRSHFSPFQINTQLYFFLEIGSSTMCYQHFEHFYTKWPPEAILFFRLMPKNIGFL